MPTDLRLTVVMPFLNEVDRLPVVLAALAGQDRPPDELVLVDDGSSDGSAGVASEFASAHAWAHVERRPPRLPGRDRLAGGAALRAFLWGVGRAQQEWDVVAKVDADLAMSPRTVSTVLGHLGADRRVGMAGPFVSAYDRDGRLVRQRCPVDHVEGQAKFYTRPCWDAISPLPEILGWDTIDEVRAELRGFSTTSLEIPGGDPVHLRAMGSHDGRLRGYRRWGECAWASGEHPLHVLATCVQRSLDRPLLVGSAHYALGYTAAAVRRAPRAEAEVLRHVSRDGRRRVFRRALHPWRPNVRRAPA